MRNTILRLLTVLLLLLPFWAEAQPCYSGSNTQTRAYLTYQPYIIDPLLQASNSSPLKLYDAKANIQFSWGSATVNFWVPAYFETDGSNKVLEIYYTNGVGPTVNLHQYPIAKVFDWYGIPSSYARMQEHYLEFSYMINQGEVPSATITPTAGMNYNIIQRAHIFNHKSVRKSTSGFCTTYLPSVGDFFDGRDDGTTHQFYEFSINSVEADFTNLLEGTYLKFCKEDQQIDLYDYFTDKNNVTFEILDISNNVIATSNIINLNSFDSGKYKVKASKSYGNGDFSKSIELIIVNVPVPTITTSLPANILSFCEGESVTLTAPIAPNGEVYTYKWSSGETSKSITINNSWEGSLSVSNGFCENVSSSLKITRNEAPKPTIQNQSGSNNICDGEDAILVTNAVGISYLWEDQDGDIVGEQQAFYATKGGTYKVTVFYANGCQNTSDPTTITVSPNPIPSITPTGSTEFCEGESVTLTAALPDGHIASYYNWSNGQSGQTITVTEAGIYTVTAHNVNGCARISEPISVVVNPIQVPEVMANGVTEFCEGGSVKLTVTNASDQDDIVWSNGETTRSITVTSGGRYYATLSKNNCQRTSDYTDVTVYPNPKPTIEAIGQTEVCEGETVTIQITNPQPNTTYTWSNGETGLQTEVSNSGNYYVVSTTSDGCSALSQNVNVIVHPLPKPTVHISGETTFCEGDSIVLTINETGTSYRWSNGETTKSITVKGGAIYTAYIGNDFGCERAADPIEVTVNPNPKPTINYTSLVACEGDSVKLTASTGVSYLWSNGATTKEIWVKHPARYSVIVTNTFDCSNFSDSVEVDILSNDLPIITSNNGFNLCQGESTELTASEGAFYLWSTGETTRTITATKAGSYSVTITNSNGCSRVSAEYELKVHQPLVLTTIPDQQICFNGDKINLDEINTNELGGVYEGDGITNNSFDPALLGEGLFKIKYIYTTNHGCISIVEFSIEVMPIDELETGEDIEVCLNDGNILLQIEGLPVGVIFDGNGVTGNLFKPQDAGVGVHEIFYTYNNKFGCISTAKRIITVTPTPSEPEVSGNNSICNNNALTLIAQSTIIDNTPITYNWYRMGEEMPFDTGKEIRYVVTKNERIYVQAVSQKGCLSERTEVLISSFTPDVRLTASTTTISQGSPVQFNLEDLPESNPSVRWEYDFGDGFRSQEKNPIHYYNKAGVYTVKVKAYSEQDCFTEVIEESYIVVEENPIVVDPPTTGEEPVEDNNPFYKTLVYPNPIKIGEQTTLRVYNKNTGVSRAILQVYSISGTPILEQHLDLKSGQNEIPVENIDRLAANSYYLFVVKFEDNRTETIKVLIL